MCFRRLFKTSSKDVVRMMEMINYPDLLRLACDTRVENHGFAEAS